MNTITDLPVLRFPHFSLPLSIPSAVSTFTSHSRAMFRMACIRFYDTRQRGEKSFSPLGLFRFIDVYGVRMDILHPIMKLEEFH